METWKRSPLLPSPSGGADGEDAASCCLHMFSPPSIPRWAAVLPTHTGVDAAYLDPEGETRVAVESGVGDSARAPARERETDSACPPPKKQMFKY